MKKYVSILCLSLFMIACNKDSSSGSSDPKSADSVGGSLATFTLKGNYLYVVDESQLNVFSVENKENPSKVNSVYVGFRIETLFPLGNYLFIGSQRGMYIYSLENPENPKKLSRYEHFTACDPVVANERNAFVTLHSTSVCGNNLNVLQVYDVADLEKPKLIHQRNLTFPRGLCLLSDKVLAVCDSDLKFFSIENPAEPILKHSVDKNYKDLIFHNNTLFAFGEREITQYGFTDANDVKTIYEISSVKY